MTNLSEALSELRKDFAKKKTDAKIGSLSDFDMVPKALTTGNLVLDSITTIGGFPLGRVIELSGPSQSGKTTSAIMCAVEHQKAVQRGEAEGAIMYLDYEHALDETYAMNLGLDTQDSDTFVYMQPNDFEEGANAFRFLMDKGVLRMCIIDSVAAMVPRAEKEKETGAVTVADRAKALHQFFRQVTSDLKKKEVSLILINHVMTVIETGARSPFLPPRKTRPGGTSIEFYSSMRIDFAKVKDIKTEIVNEITGEKENRITQTDVIATVFKNKVGLPNKFGKMRVRFGRGFSQPFSAFQALVGLGVVKKKPAGVYVFPDNLRPEDEDIPKGEDNIISKLELDEEWLGRLVEAAKQAILAYDKNNDTLEEATFDPRTGEVIGDFE